MMRLATAALNKYVDSLRKSGLYDTHQRRTILDIIAKSVNKHSSFNEIAKKAKRIDSAIGKITVYRTLALFAKYKVISSYIDKKGVTRYEFPEHKHIHIACDRCGKVIEHKDIKINSFIKKILFKENFCTQDFSLQITATCTACQRK